MNAKSFFYVCTEIVRTTFTVSLAISSNKFLDVSVDWCQQGSSGGQKP